jgi:23S rRNA (uracil1939-C5)-methyltransferase
LSAAITLTIEKFAPPGNGLGFFQGKAVFVPLTLPGDRVEVGIEKEKKRHIIARLKKVVQAGELRRDPPCSHYQECGGCDLLHLDYADQVGLKLAMLKETLAGAGVVPQAPIRLLPDENAGAGSRHRALFHYDSERRLFGFKPRRRHRVVAIDLCRALAPGLKSLLSELGRRQDLPASTTAVRGLAASSGSFAAVLVQGRKTRPLAGVADTVVEEYGWGKMELAAEGFAQANPAITRALIADLVASCPLNTEVAELYGGSGTFSLALASRTSKLTVYESDRRAAARARRNLAVAGAGRVNVVCGRVEEKNLSSSAATIVVDPPRTGLAPAVRQRIRQSRAENLFYVSCNPATLARDLDELLSGPEPFTLVSLKAYDMYPGTTHLETLACLSR